MPKKLFIVGCEASADTHGAHLIEELLELEPDMQLRGLGGPRMESAGMELLVDMTHMSALGFGDVIRQYFKYREIFYRALDEIRKWKPDAVLVIDSPAFNLRLAKKISGEVPVLYYISPQLWAWGKRRISVVKKHISCMLSILPFEVDMYGEAGVPCEFVGHPLLDQIQIPEDRKVTRHEILHLEAGEIAVGLLAGSRKKEVERIFPVMVESASLLHEDMPQTRFFYVQAPNVPADHYTQVLDRYPGLPVTRSQISFHDLVHAMDFALVTSGTATLETALLGTPFFLLYKTAWTTYFLGKHMIRVPYLGLVNLLAGKPVVPEYIQNDACPVTIAHEVEVLLKNPGLYESMKEEFRQVRRNLGEKGAGEKAARAVMNFLNRKQSSAATVKT